MGAPAPALVRERRDFELLGVYPSDGSWSGDKLRLTEEGAGGLGVTVVVEDSHGRQVKVRLEGAQLTALAWELLSRGAAIGRAR